jgi:hypothetical protein
MKYRAIVSDTMGILKERKTVWYKSYKRAYEAAEYLCNYTYCNRGKITIEEKRFYE